MSGVINKVKNALHSDNTTTTGTTHTSTTTHPTHTTGTTHTGVPEGVAGPHGSRTANAADPRVDSDLDGRGANYGTHGTHATHGTNTTGNYTTGSSGLTGGTSHGTSSGLTGNHATTGHTGGSNLTGHSTHNPNTTGLTGAGHSTNSTAGPHQSNLLNKADPTVDSDLSRTGGHAHATGAQGTHHNAGLTGATHTGAGGLTGNTAHNTTHSGSGLTGHNTHNPNTTGLTGAGHSTNSTAGPHRSDALNKADPRIDSDLSKTGGHAHTGGHAQSTHNNGLTGNNNHSTGTHAGNSHGNVLGSHATPGSGTATKTAGPHNSDLLNKLDPRVDSNLDGSKTIGGNKTHQDITTYAHKDVHDASQVPPSVFAAHKGEPEILHGDHSHDRAGRHGSISHQEKHSGI